MSIQNLSATPATPIQRSPRPVPGSAEKLQKSATDFEAFLISQMLKSTRESGGGMTGDAEEQDETNSTMMELGEQQLALALSASGGLGIAKMVIAGLTNHAHR
jgi:Rod binding domain-containing protein